MKHGPCLNTTLLYAHLYSHSHATPVVHSFQPSFDIDGSMQSCTLNAHFKVCLMVYICDVYGVSFVEIGFITLIIPMDVHV